MSSIALYLLKVILCSGALYGYYFLALRNRIFHQWNRFYLLSAVLFSLVFPLIPLPDLYRTSVAPEQIQLYGLLTSTGSETEVLAGGSAFLKLDYILTILYALVALFFMVQFAAGLWQIRKLLRQSEVQQLGAVAFVSTQHSSAPFSFFRWLFWKKDIDLHSPGGQSIFRHELVHISEHHSLDKIFLQLTLALFWINPFFWIIRRELQMIHEFIADKKAVGNEGTEALAAMILQSVYGKQFSPITNSFFQQPIKRRLAMLQKTLKQPRNAYLGRVLTLPLCAALLFAFAKNETQKSNDIALDKTLTVVIDAGHGGEDVGATVNGIREKDLTLELAKTIQAINTNDKIRIVLTRSGDEYPNLKDRVALVTKEKADLFISLHAQASPKDQNGSNNNLAGGIDVHVSGKNEASRNRSTLLGSAIIQHLSTVYPTRANLLTRQTGVWVLDANTVPAVLIECGYLTNPKDLAFINQKKNQEVIAKQILSAIAAFASSPVQTSAPSVDTLPKKIDTTNIKEMHVNKVDGNNTITLIYKNGKKATYTEKEARAGGLLLPPPPPPVQKPEMPAPPPPPPPMNDKALVVVDGKEVGTLASARSAGKLPKQENYKSANVLKDEYATNKYGEKGKYGVIEITTLKTIDNNKVFLKVEQPPKFPGGESAWRTFLEKNLNAGTPVDKGAPAGTYTTILEFLVSDEGTVSDVKAISKHGYGMEEEVVALMQKSPNWEPAIQNGKKVAALHKQPITFVVAEE